MGDWKLTRPQLIRFKNRLEKAGEAIDSARYWMSEALAAVGDVDPIPVGEPIVSAAYDVEHARNLMDAASSLLAGAQDGGTEQKKRTPKDNADPATMAGCKGEV